MYGVTILVVSYEIGNIGYSFYISENHCEKVSLSFIVTFLDDSVRLVVLIDTIKKREYMDGKEDAKVRGRATES